MYRMTALSVLIAGLAVPGAVEAGMTEMERAMASGAKRLDSDAIAETMVGKTVKWVSAANGAEVLIHYGEDNAIEGRSLDGDWTGTGFYGVTNDDRICLSWHGRDQGRLRCLSVVMIEDVPHKFRADGSESGALVRIEDGKAW